MSSSAKARRIEARKAAAKHKDRLRQLTENRKPIPVHNMACSGPMVVTEESVTPAMAEVWLASMGPNRNMMDGRVSLYARDMAAGKWQVNGETIKFDRAGRLLDGQHRLAACMLAGRIFRTAVARGVIPDAMHTIDTGRTRTAGQILHLSGMANANIVAAALGWLWRKENNRLTGYGHAVRPTTQELHALAAQHPEIHRSATVGNHCHRLTMPSVHAFCHYLFSRIDSTLADAFYEQLRTGESLRADDPIYSLRERLHRSAASKAGRGRLTELDTYALIVRAWNAVRKGKVTGRRGLVLPKDGADVPEPC